MNLWKLIRSHPATARPELKFRQRYEVRSNWSIFSYANYSSNDKADGIIVLGAVIWRSQPSPVFRERNNHAINLYKDGYANTIISTGGKGDNNELSEAEVAKQYAIEYGIAPDKILAETYSKSTEQNLCYAKQLVVAHHLTTLIIVNDPLHMKRAMLMAENIGLKAYSSPTPTTQYKSLIVTTHPDLWGGYLAAKIQQRIAEINKFLL